MKWGGALLSKITFASDDDAVISCDRGTTQGGFRGIPFQAALSTIGIHGDASSHR